MADRIFENSLIVIIGAVVSAAVGAIVSALLNTLLAKNANIGYWGIGAFLGIIIFLFLYLIYRKSLSRFPVKKWRVTNAKDGTGLCSDGRLIGKPGQVVCQLETDYTGFAVWGPATGDGQAVPSIPGGKYSATFKLKVNHKSGPNVPIIEISVSANTADGLGTKFLAARTLSPIDFNYDDEYQYFTLYFDVYDKENGLELRIFSKNSSRVVTLDYVQVSRRLF